ncbi:MAG: hypothetical protein HY964_03955 [Ignavibacteriales bacterium]|nr:hypothetical protein [Ignavibacteriales bacterium]
MKQRLLFMVLTFILSNLTIAQTAIKKYDIKSGIITYETIMKMGDFEIKNKIIVSFDEYGMKECKDTYTDKKLEESYFSDGKNLYSVKYGSKTAYKRGIASRGTELRVEWSEFGTEKDRKAGKYKKLPSQKFAGKNCDMFEYNDGAGSITQYGGWNKILLYMSMKTKSMESTQRAVKIEENVKVSPDKFKIQSGFKVE